MAVILEIRRKGKRVAIPTKGIEKKFVRGNGLVRISCEEKYSMESVLNLQLAPVILGPRSKRVSRKLNPGSKAELTWQAYLEHFGVDGLKVRDSDVLYYSAQDDMARYSGDDWSDEDWC